MAADASHPRPLAGRTIVTTRERAGRLDDQLRSLGASVLHVPLLTTIDPSDGGAELARALADVTDADWVVVTSPVGAERIAVELASVRCRIAAVGTRTAEIVTDLAGRPPDVVPGRQTGAGLVAAMPAARPGERLLLFQADRADPATAAGLGELGYAVTAVTAYRTLLRAPTSDERRAMLAADAVAFASGSAVSAWVDAVGRATPPVVAAIGPTTAGVATRSGVKVTTVAADHSIEGLVQAVVGALNASRTRERH